MSAFITAQRAVKRWRVIIFAVVATLLVFLFFYLFGGLFSLPEPWVILPGASDTTYHAEIHRWHDAQWGAMIGLLLGGSLLSMVWQGHKRPLIAQFFAFSALFLTVTFVLFDLIAPTNWTHVSITQEIYGNYSPLIVLSIFVLAYPAPRALLRFAGSDSPSYLLLGLTFIAALLLTPTAVHEIHLQFNGVIDEHVYHNHWLSSVQLAFLLITAGSLASTRRPGWQALGIITGIAFFYLGAAAFTVPTQAGSWGIIGGILGMLGGVAYLVATVIEARRAKKPASLPTPEPAST